MPQRGLAVSVLTRDGLTEVILSLLLTKFTFELTDKRIVWNLSGVRFPSVEGSTKPCMPLRVGLYQGPGAAVSSSV